MKKFQLYFSFYKNIFGLLLIVSLGLAFFNIAFPIVIMTKILIFSAIWFFKYIDDTKDKKFFFYYNLGVTKFGLFLYSFIIDFFLFVIIKTIV